MPSDLPDKSPYILFLTKWYPSLLDPQLGIFVRKHASAVSDFTMIAVIYVTGADDLKSKHEYSVSVEKNLREYTGYYQTAKGVFHRFINLYRYLRTFRYLLRQITQLYGYPELIHSHVLLRPALLAWFYSRKLSVPYVHTEHWTGFIHGAYRRKSILYKWLCKKSVARAETLTVVSDGLKSAMAVNGLLHPDTLIIPNIIEARNIERTFDTDRKKIRILTVADLVERNKNISGTIKALEILKIKYPEIEFHVIGGGQDADLIHSLAGKADPHSEWIKFYGKRDNIFVLEFLQGIDFLITNSTIETFSVITAEAIAAGKPVIATRCGGPEYFVTPENGILIEPGIQAVLVEAIETMLQSFSNYDPVVLSAGILSKFGRQAVGKQLMGLYQKILKK
ncbi:MAG: glycosyltransferase [Bacteroidales bacterium]